jgi:predicted dehydrogenase
MRSAALMVLIFFAVSCGAPSKPPSKAEGNASGRALSVAAGIEGEVRLITLDPGHFHASLVQKNMISGVSRVVQVYAPEGPELRDHLARIRAFNNRATDPTHWEERVTTGPDFLERMVRERKGSVVVIAGNNARKTAYIKAAVDAGLSVLADKPMAVTAADFELLREAFAAAERNGVLLYDIMTERSEITTVLQRELIAVPALFGVFEQGTVEDPAVVKASVHHFFKIVAGSPLIRPPWFFDTSQQGEGIVDVTAHLVDLVQWECFPGEVIDGASDIVLERALRSTTPIARDQFRKATGLADFPDFLRKYVRDGVLQVSCNGEIDYALRGIHARVSVAWKFEPPEGGGDTHFSIIRGTKANVVIRQEAEQKFRPEIYVEPAKGGSLADVSGELKRAMPFLQRKYPGLKLAEEPGRWHVLIPDAYRVGHEAHFGQVAERFLQYLKDGRLPAWEVPGMLAKYRLTTQALALALEK